MFKKGRKSWLKGKKHSLKSSKKMSQNNSHFWKGKEYPKELIDKLRKFNIGNKYNFGNHHSEETKRKMSIAASHPRPHYKGKGNPNWNGGKSFEPYGLEFNNELKEIIRKRDNYRCQECFRHQDELFRNTKSGLSKCKLYIHHIDYDKQNNKPSNLISLCLKCHIKTNFKREEWIRYFKEAYTKR